MHLALIITALSLTTCESKPVSEDDHLINPSSSNCIHRFPLVSDEHPTHVNLPSRVARLTMRTKRSSDSVETVIGEPLRIKVFYHESVEKELPSDKRKVVQDQVGEQIGILFNCVVHLFLIDFVR